MDEHGTGGEPGTEEPAPESAYELLQQWIDCLPQPVVRARPKLALAQAMLVTFGGDRELAEAWLATAEAFVAQPGLNPARDAELPARHPPSPSRQTTRADLAGQAHEEWGEAWHVETSR